MVGGLVGSFVGALVVGELDGSGVGTATHCTGTGVGDGVPSSSILGFDGLIALVQLVPSGSLL